MHFNATFTEAVYEINPLMWKVLNLSYACHMTLRCSQPHNDNMSLRCQRSDSDRVCIEAFGMD